MGTIPPPDGPAGDAANDTNNLGLTKLTPDQERHAQHAYDFAERWAAEHGNDAARRFIPALFADVVAGAVITCETHGFAWVATPTELRAMWLYTELCGRFLVRLGQSDTRDGTVNTCSALAHLVNALLVHFSNEELTELSRVKGANDVQ